MAKQESDEDNAYPFFTGFPLMSEAKRAFPVLESPKEQAVQVNRYDHLLSGRSLVTVRRGQSTSLNVISNIGTCLFGGKTSGAPLH
jgi:hypothetical protein